VHMPRRDYESIVGRITVHCERNSTFSNASVRDERVV
jgi:hypothetical protein